MSIFHLISRCGNFCKNAVSAKYRANRPRFCRNCAFPQNFHNRKLDKISVFYAVLFMSLQIVLVNILSETRKNNFTENYFKYRKKREQWTTQDPEILYHSHKFFPFLMTMVSPTSKLQIIICLFIKTMSNKEILLSSYNEQFRQRLFSHPSQLPKIMLKQPHKQRFIRYQKDHWLHVKRNDLC